MFRLNPIGNFLTYKPILGEKCKIFAPRMHSILHGTHTSTCYTVVKCLHYRFWNAIRKVTHYYKCLVVILYTFKYTNTKRELQIEVIKHKPVEKIYATHKTYCSIVIKKQTEERYFPFVLAIFPPFAVSRPAYVIQTSKQMDKFSLFHSTVSVCSFSESTN